MYEVQVVEDSIAAGVRLTTMLATFPRFILAEFNTHRMLCLASDAELEFDLPGAQRSGRRVHRMRIDEFVDKWLHGARRFAANPKREYDLSWVEDDRVYSAPHAASRMGMASAASIHALCRSGVIDAYQKNRTWWITGGALKRWRQSAPEHTRFDMRAKLGAMRIRQLNEDTGEIQWAHVADAYVSGTKDVYEVIAGDYTVAGSRDHRVMTTSGWKTIGELTRGDLLVVRRFGKRVEDRADPMRLLKIDGVWRSQWQRVERARLQALDSLCRRCCAASGTDIHHIEPVYQNPARALDQTNITLLCAACHEAMHEKQGWQGGTYLYGAAVPVEEVRFRGVGPTYDLAITGAYPNFLANGVVVHNSRNSASSRAIPVEKRIAQVLLNPFVPEAFTVNRRGMQATETLVDEATARARHHWLEARDAAVAQAARLCDLGVHKQHANRLLEPFCWHTVIVTATEWDNFFALRCHAAAQPEMQIIASLMRDARAASEPQVRLPGEWHLPFVEDVSATLPDHIKVSVARCAAVSFERHGDKKDVDECVARHNILATSAHWSPFEHQARVMSDAELQMIDSQVVFFGNLRLPWKQYRKTFDGEAVFSG